MNILILNGSPRKDGVTSKMIEAFASGAKENGHDITVIQVGDKKIAGCMACEYCHTRGNGHCIQQDEMQEIYPELEKADMIVIGSPIYYHNMTGQMQCVINRTYAVGIPGNLKKCAIFLASGSPDMYDGALFEYRNTFLRYMKLEDMGIFTLCGEESREPDAFERLRSFGRSIK